VETYREDRERLRQSADAAPRHIDWDALAAEMTANIHVGIEAGECVTPRGQRASAVSPRPAWLAAWRPAAVAAGVTVLLVGAWWLNLPGSSTESLLRAFRSIGARAGVAPAQPADDGIALVEVSDTGRIFVREKGSALEMSQGVARPLSVLVSAEGSASARFIDADTGQITIASVYVQP
jgi:hypothetical protein